MRRVLPVEARAPTGGLLRATITYASSIDPSIADLSADVVLADGGADLPILVAIHGYAETKSAIDASLRERWARAGACVVVPGMRGRDGASGSRDASGREPFDLLDAVDAVRALYPGVVSERRAAPVGYSGGGGSALAALAKAPDRWTGCVAHFGPSDYGWAADGWYYTNPAFQASLTVDVGAAPSVQPAWWRSRDHRTAIPRVLLAARGTGARAPLLHLLHDQDDASVSVVQSSALVAACDELGAGDLLELHLSTGATPAAERYLHGYPSQVPGLLAGEALWLPQLLRAPAWQVPAAGELDVRGWLETSRFAVWLGEDGQDPKSGTQGGKASAARVRWSIPASGPGTFTLSPAAAGASYRIERGAAVATGTLYETVTVVA